MQTLEGKIIYLKRELSSTFGQLQTAKAAITNLQARCMRQKKEILHHKEYIKGMKSAKPVPAGFYDSSLDRSHDMAVTILKANPTLKLGRSICTALTDEPVGPGSVVAEWKVVEGTFDGYEVEYVGQFTA